MCDAATGRHNRAGPRRARQPVRTCAVQATAFRGAARARVRRGSAAAAADAVLSRRARPRPPTATLFFSLCAHDRRGDVPQPAQTPGPRVPRRAAPHCHITRPLHESARPCPPQRPAARCQVQMRFSTAPARAREQQPTRKRARARVWRAPRRGAGAARRGARRALEKAGRFASRAAPAGLPTSSSATRRTRSKGGGAARARRGPWASRCGRHALRPRPPCGGCGLFAVPRLAGWTRAAGRSVAAAVVLWRARAWSLRRCRRVFRRRYTMVQYCTRWDDGHWEQSSVSSRAMAQAGPRRAHGESGAAGCN